MTPHTPEQIERLAARLAAIAVATAQRAKLAEIMGEV